MTALYTEDAQLLPSDFGIVNGRGTIQGFWQDAMDSDPSENSLETLEIQEAGDMAVEIGTWAAKNGNHGKYLVIWKKTNDGWMLHREIWNNSAGEES